MAHSPEYRRILHKMGYYGYQNGLIYRHLGQEGGWDEHNRNCRSYIIRAVDHFKPDKVTILGSGWLLDIPLAELAGKVKSVVLADIVHPPEVRQQVEPYPNVELREFDVTGCLIKEVWNKTRLYSFVKKMKSLSSIEISGFNPDEDPGFVISLNILTQLENLPIELIRKKARVPEAEYDDLRSKIQKKHIDLLTKFRSVLITDTEEIFIVDNGDERVVPTLRTEIPDGMNMEEWIWHFDMKKSDYYTSRSVLKVKAVTFVK